MVVVVVVVFVVVVIVVGVVVVGVVVVDVVVVVVVVQTVELCACLSRSHKMLQLITGQSPQESDSRATVPARTPPSLRGSSSPVPVYRALKNQLGTLAVNRARVGLRIRSPLSRRKNVRKRPNCFRRLSHERLSTIGPSRALKTLTCS